MSKFVKVPSALCLPFSDVNKHLQVHLQQARFLVFDLDGTLFDSRQDLDATVNTALGHFGEPRLSIETVASYVGDGALRLLKPPFAVPEFLPNLSRRRTSRT